MNLIIKAIETVAPGYEVTEVELQRIAHSPDPSAAAKALPGLLESMAKSMARKAPHAFDWRLVPVYWLIPAINWRYHSTKLRIDFHGMLSRVGGENFFRMGYIACKAQVWGADAHIDAVAELYHRHQNRLPDHAGLMFWLEALHTASDAAGRARVFEALEEGLLAGRQDSGKAGGTS